LCRPK